MSQVKIGVYFGTLSPVTENHIAMLVYAARNFFTAVYVAVNPENPSKQNSLELDVRQEALRARLHQPDVTKYKIYVYNTSGLALDWIGRGEVCRKISLNWTNNSGVKIHQIMGSDSFGTRGCQEALSQPEILNNLRREIMVFMRDGDGPLIIPPHLAGVVWVPPYRDKLKMSSTHIRSLMQQTKGAAPDPRFLHPVVYHIVKPYFQSEKRKHSSLDGEPTVLISGGPGSGKTTLLRALTRHFGGWGISTGEMFRLGRTLHLPMWPWPGLDPKSGHWKYFDDISAAVIRELVSDFEQKPLFIDGISIETPDKVEEYTGRKVTHVVHIDCAYELLVYRMAARGRAGETTPEQRERRANGFLKRQWARDKTCAHSPPFDYLVLKGGMATDDMVQRVSDEFGFQNYVSREPGIVASDAQISATLKRVSDEIQEKLKSPIEQRSPTYGPESPSSYTNQFGGASPDYRPQSPSDPVKTKDYSDLFD